MRLLVVVAMLSGCTVPQARKARTASEIALGSSLGGMLASITVAYFVPSEKGVFLDAGLAFVPVALASAAAYVVCDSLLQHTEEPVDQRERARQTAWELAREAKHAAREGDCAQVQAIGPRVRDLDSEVYVRFLRDTIIRPCLVAEEEH